MAISVIEKIEIDAIPADVAKIMFDPNNDIRWMGGIHEVRKIDSLPLKEGSTVHRIAGFAGKKIDYILEVVRVIPDHLLEFETTKSPFPMNIIYQISDFENNKSLAQITLKGSSKGFLMFLDRLSTIMVSQNLKGDLRHLRDMVEGKTWQENPPSTNDVE